MCVDSSTALHQLWSPFLILAQLLATEPCKWHMVMCLPHMGCYWFLR